MPAVSNEPAMAENDSITVPAANVGEGQSDGDLYDGHDIHSLSSSPPDQDAISTPLIEPVTPETPKLSRNPSFSGSSSYHEDWEAFPPLDRISMLDILDNFALPQQLEKIQKGISAQTRKVRKSRDAFKSKSQHARERMVEEWRRRVPTAEEQLDRYRARMRRGVDKLGKQWNDTKVITLREKVSFICGVMNIFISGVSALGVPSPLQLLGVPFYTGYQVTSM